MAKETRKQYIESDKVNAEMKNTLNDFRTFYSKMFSMMFV